MKLLFAILLVCAFGAGAFFLQTEGYTVLTTEGARRADVLRRPRPVPDVAVHDGRGKATTLLKELGSDPRVAIITFMYTRCVTVCVSSGIGLQQLQGRILAQGLQDQVRLLSISFDPADTPERLARYEYGMNAAPDLWRALGMADAVESASLLNAFSVIVVPAPLGQYEHNAAYHVVTPDGRLTRIVDIDETETLLRHAVAPRHGRKPT
ncbi:MAG TPA: SCO family protein [Candidimonas sp.]|nr:SCO family protein [Candidimonas sp.]